MLEATFLEVPAVWRQHFSPVALMSSVMGENAAECGEQCSDRPAHMDVFFLARNASIERSEMH